MKIALLTGFMAMFVMPLAASADVILTIGPDAPGATTSGVVTMDLYMTTQVGTATDNATWSIGCTDCQIQTFLYNEAYGAGSGLVTWGNGKTTGPFAMGGTQVNLNTSGSGAAAGDGLGTIIGDGSYVGSIGFITATQPMNGDGTGYLIGSITVHRTGAAQGVVETFFRTGEGIFNLAPAVPTQFSTATLGSVPEPTTASLLALGLGGLALLGRRNRR
jgi:hypothetical protein